MANSLNTFPLIIAVRDDGSTDDWIRGFEQSLSAGASRAAGVLNQITRQVDQLSRGRAQANSDPFGFKAQVAALASNPVQRFINQQIDAENALSRQRQQATQQRIADTMREFDAAISAIKAEQAARTAAFRQAEQEGNALVALQRQRLAESAKMVAEPQQIATVYFDPRGAQAAATAARAQASALEQVAAAAERTAQATSSATATDRAFAATAREAASAANLEASRLEELAATQLRVAAAAAEAGAGAVRATDLVTNSVRNQRLVFLQGSQQVQDFFIQIQGGTNPMIAFTQQASQLAFVLASTGGETGKFARFMGGPWGTAIFAAISVLTLLTAGLFDNAKAQDEAGEAAKRMEARQQSLAKFFEQTTGRIKEQNQAIILNQVLNSQKDLAEARKSYAAQRADLLGRRTRTTLLLQEGGAASIQTPEDPAIVAALDRYAAGGAGAASRLASDLYAIGKAQPGLKSTTDELIKMTNALVATAREGAQAQAATKILLGDTSEDTRRQAFGDFSPRTADTSKLRADAAVAAIDAGNDALRAASARRKAALEQLDKDFNVKGGVIPESQAAAYQARAQAIEEQYSKEKEAAEAANKARSKAAADARRIAGEHRRELFADAAAIGDGTDAIKAANSVYAAEITRLKNQLREGVISDAQAKAAAINARQIRNAAIEAAQGAKQLDEALQRIGQEFDGDSRFVNRIDKARDAIAKARDQLGTLGAGKIGENFYSAEDLDRLSAQVEAAYVRPITDANRQLQEQLQIDAAILEGREDEAEFLRAKFQILQSYGELTDSERAALESQIEPLRDLIALEYERSQEIERQRDLIDIQVRAAQDLQNALTDALTNPFRKGALTDLGNAITDIRKRTIAQQLSIQLFGNMGSDVERALTRGTGPLIDAATHHETAAEKLIGAAGSLVDSSKVMAEVLKGAAAGPSAAQLAATPTAYGLPSGTPTAVNDNGDIVVTGRRLPQTDLTGSISAVDLAPLFAIPQFRIQQTTSEKIYSTLDKMQVPLSFLSSAVGGRAGNAISAVQNISTYSKLGKDIAKEIKGPIGEALGGAVEGLGIGSAVDAVGKTFGLKSNSTVTQLGGAIGGAIAGPLGALAGSVLGAIGSSFFYKAPKASAGLTIANGEVQVSGVSGNSSKLQAGAKDMAAAVGQGLQQIADQLGGVLTGSTDVRIGYYKDKIRVNDHGGAIGGVKGSGAISFDTEQQAIAYAIADALKDGVLTGIRDGTKRLLSTGNDLDRQLQKALSFEGVFTELERYRNPAKAAMDDLTKEYDRLKDIFKEAGATTEEYAQLEELFTYKRKEAMEQQVSQLNSFLDSLRVGDNGLSLRTREKNALAMFDPLAATIRAGGTVDQDKFTEAAQALLDISRELYGSTGAYFDRLNEITGLTGQAIGNATGTNPLTTQVNQQVAQLAVQVANDNSAANAAAIGNAVAAALNDNTPAVVERLAANFSSDDIVTAVNGLRGDLVAGFNTLSGENRTIINKLGTGTGNAPAFPMTLRNA